MKRLAFLIIMLMVAAGSTFAQTAQFSGTITDSSGAVVPKATVTVLNADKGYSRTVESNDAGYYLVPSLQPGNYAVTVQVSGFQTVTREALTLAVGAAVRLDVTLRPGAIQQTITVQGNANPLETESAAVGTTVDRQFVANMPLNGRSFQSLIELTPGVVAASTNYNNQGQFNVNGQRADTNYFTVDGASANTGVGVGGAINTAGSGSLPATSANGGFNNLISVDAMQEFKIETSTYAPEYGRTPGAQVSIVSRSGTNTLHGDAFDYLRNEIFDANDWFLNNSPNPATGVAPTPRPPLRQNDFGGVLGGPIVKGKLFFFFSYEGLRLAREQADNTFVPSLCVRGKGPCTVSGQLVAPASIQPWLNAYPLPTRPQSAIDPNVAPFIASVPGRSQLNATSLRIDYQLSNRMLLFGRYDYAPSNVLTQVSSDQLPTENSLQTFTLGDTFTITPRMSNDFRLNYSHAIGNSSGKTVSFHGSVPLPESQLFPLPNYPRNKPSISTFYPLVEIDPLMDGTVGQNRSHQWNLVDTFSYVVGSHELKFGFDYRQLTPVYRAGLWSEFPEFFSSSSWATGMVDILAIVSEPGEAYRINNYSSFAQDIWKTNSRLTITYGIRWDVNPGITSPNGTSPFAMAQFDTNNPGAFTLAPFGTPTWKTSWNNLAPRAGVAYQVSRNQRWGNVLRTGFGIFYDNASSAAGFVYGPYANERDALGVPFPPPSSLNINPSPISLSPPFFGHTQTTDPNLKMPYVYQYNVAVQQQLGADQSISATYVGAIGRRLIRTENYYPTVASPIFPTYITLWRSTGSSNYNALQLQFQRRLSRGLQVLASYSWSHSIDDGSQATDFSSTSVFHIGNFTSTNRGLSDFDVRHAFQTAISYNIPSPGENWVAKGVLGHWSIDTIYRYRTAPPLTVSAGFFEFKSGAAATGIPLRADVVSGMPIYISDPSAPGGRKLNPAAFTAPPLDPVTGNPLRQGNLGRNTLTAFGSQQVDLALRRDFPFAERYRLEFRADLFNIFNHPSFAPEDNVLGDPNFGRSTSMLAGGLGSGNGSNGGSGGFNPLYQIGGPRSMQLSLKFRF